MAEITLPCKIGDMVWTARRYAGGGASVRCAPVSAMFFTPQMELIIAVKGTGRGKWGVHVFATKEEADAAFADPEHSCIPFRRPEHSVSADTLCWSCKKSGGLCSWSHAAIPVKGWEVVETSRDGYKDTVGYTVVRCPEFVEG
jgi:hypothetical protein